MKNKMVRFARAEGSKGSNKRQLEEPTPWVEMVEQIESNKKKKKIKKEKGSRRKDDDTLGQTMKNYSKEIDDGDQDIKPQNTLQHVMKQESEANKKEKNEPVQPTQDLVKNKEKKKKGLKTKEPEYTISEGKKVKVFRDGTQRTWFDLPYEENDLMTRYEGMWVKQEMVGELTRLKAALEEEGLDKKEMMRKMMKAKRKAHRQLRIELIYQQKKLVSEATGEEVKDGTVSKEKKKCDGITSSKKKKKQKTTMMETDSPFSQSKIGDIENDESECNQEDVILDELLNTEEQMIDCSESEGKGDMKRLSTNQADVRVKKQKIKNTVDKVKENKSPKNEKLEKTTTPLGIDAEEYSKGEGNMEVPVIQQDDNITKNKKKIKEKKLRAEEAASQTDEEDSTKADEMTAEIDGKVKRKNIDCDLEKNVVSSKMEKKGNRQGSEDEECYSFPKKNQVQSYDLSNTTEYLNSHCDFEENELMTNYDGYWVLHEDVESLEAAKKSELEALYSARTDGTASCKGELTQEEQLALQRAMKKRKRFHHRKLLGKLSRMGKKVGDEGKKKGNDKEVMKKNVSDKVVKFDGFWVKKEAADRLHKLRKKLYNEGLSQQEVDSLVQKERRKEERVLKNERKLVCLNCRQPGHMVSACPSIVQAEGEGQPSICYTCGSTEHTSSTCNLKKGSEKSFSFATCYICKESGHISRQCPDNPRGLYPKGGACRGCGSVEHLAKDCPDLQREKEESSIKVGRLKGEELEALDAEEEPMSDEDEASSHIKQNIPKVVKF